MEAIGKVHDVMLSEDDVAKLFEISWLPIPRSKSNILFTFFMALFSTSFHFWLRTKTTLDNTNNKNTSLRSPLTISGLIILSLALYSIPTWTRHLELLSSRTWWLLQVLAYLFVVMYGYYLIFVIRVKYREQTEIDARICLIATAIIYPTTSQCNVNNANDGTKPLLPHPIGAFTV